MNIFSVLCAIIAVIYLSPAALAQDMRCGNKLIAGEQIHPLIKEQVLEICGEPTSKDMDRWYYEEQHKILVFNGNGELEEIQEAAQPE
ncbi:MAG: DUF2845 domain-containing protein [Pseudomonadota bacterium]